MRLRMRMKKSSFSSSFKLLAWGNTGGADFLVKNFLPTLCFAENENEIWREPKESWTYINAREPS